MWLIKTWFSKFRMFSSIQSFPKLCYFDTFSLPAQMTLQDSWVFIGCGPDGGDKNVKLKWTRSFFFQRFSEAFVNAGVLNLFSSVQSWHPRWRSRGKTEQTVEWGKSDADISSRFTKNLQKVDKFGVKQVEMCRLEHFCQLLLWRFK